MKSIRDMRAALDAKELSVRELTEFYLNNIKSTDDKVMSYITVCEQLALSQADAAQKLIDAGESKPLTGIPLAIKDNICTEGVRTTCASKMLENFVPPYNATVMERLEAQGIVMLGKTSMDEFAMGGSTQTSAFAKTKNPYDLSCVPGGSSGGSAAAVSAQMCAAALGSDTGGSIRQPSSFCGVVGMKPTYGRVSRYGLVAFASSFDQIGPIAHSSADCALILDQISGYDRHDGTSASCDAPAFSSELGKSVEGLKIALPREFFEQGIDDEVKASVVAAAESFKEMGATLVDCSMSTLKYAIPAYYLIASAEAASNLSRYDGIKYGHRTAEADSYEQLIKLSRSEGFGDEVKRRILLGNYALSSGYYDAYYGKAMALRQAIREEYDKIFAECDAVLTPTAPTVAYRPEQQVSDPVKMYQADICTVTVNIAGLPAISTPCGYDKKGMPIGMSIVGKRFADHTVIRLADAYEQTFAAAAPKL